jgi:hypothetical protein
MDSAGSVGNICRQSPVMICDSFIVHYTSLAWPVAMHIKKFGTKANPFMDRAWDKEQANIDAFFEAAQANIAKQIGGS